MSTKTRSESRRRARRVAEAHELGLNYAEYQERRRTNGELPPLDAGVPRKPPPKPRSQPAVRVLSERARQLVERERQAERSGVIFRPVFACPKVRYTDLVAADAALRRMLAAPDADPSLFDLQSYDCARCGGTHLGNRVPSRVREHFNQGRIGA